MKLTVLRIQRMAQRPITIALPSAAVAEEGFRFLSYRNGRMCKTPNRRGSFKRVDVESVQIATRNMSGFASHQFAALAKIMSSALRSTGSTGYYTATEVTLRNSDGRRDIVVACPLDGPLTNVQAFALTDAEAGDFMNTLRYSHFMAQGMGMYLSADKPPVLKNDVRVDGQPYAWVTDRMAEATQRVLTDIGRMLEEEELSLHLTLAQL